MPDFPIPAKVRLGLYIASALMLLLVTFFSDMAWIGEPLERLITGIAALLSLLAASKTPVGAQAAVR